MHVSSRDYPLVGSLVIALEVFGAAELPDQLKRFSSRDPTIVGYQGIYLLKRSLSAVYSFCTKMMMQQSRHGVQGGTRKSSSHRGKSRTVGARSSKHEHK